MGIKVDLNKIGIMSITEASKKWGLADRTIRSDYNLKKFPPGTIKQVGKTWIVTHEGMEAVFGEPLSNEKD